MKSHFVVFASLLLVQCSPNHQQETIQAVVPTPASTPVPKLAANEQTTTAEAVFNLDALYGLSIDQLKAKLGKPIKDLQSNVDGSQREGLFEKEGFLLDVNYDVQSRRVDILLLSDKPERLSYKQLLILSNADTTSIRYKVEASKGPNTGRSDGVQVTPREEEQPSE